MSKKKPENINAEAADFEPVVSFYGWQLVSCKALNAPQDVILAVLEQDGLYTLAEAKTAINNFMSRKV